eukprot:scaffold28033_cov152-Isochrysis_galbana.AAC.1
MLRIAQLRCRVLGVSCPSSPLLYVSSMSLLVVDSVPHWLNPLSARRRRSANKSDCGTSPPAAAPVVASLSRPMPSKGGAAPCSGCAELVDGEQRKGASTSSCGGSVPQALTRRTMSAMPPSSLKAGDAFSAALALLAPQRATASKPSPTAERVEAGTAFASRRSFRTICRASTRSALRCAAKSALPRGCNDLVGAAERGELKRRSPTRRIHCRVLARRFTANSQLIL